MGYNKDNAIEGGDVGFVRDELDKITITGGRKLSGEVRISGAKNAVLPIIVATLLSEGRCVLEDVPRLADVEIIKDVLLS